MLLKFSTAKGGIYTNFSFQFALGLRPLPRYANSKLNFFSSEKKEWNFLLKTKGRHQAEAQIIVIVIRLIAVAIGYTAAPSTVAPATATIHPVRTL